MSEVRESRTLRTIFLLLAPCLMSTCLHAQYGGGTGEPNDPYLIYTPAQMNAIGADPNDWDKRFKLMADIDLGAYESFNSIGSKPVPFSGVFDGDGRTITHLNCVALDQNEIGLFGCVFGPGAQIRSLTLVDPNIQAGDGHNVGSLAGRFATGRIANCRVIGGVVCGGQNVGGLVGGGPGSGESPRARPRAPVEGTTPKDIRIAEEPFTHPALEDCGFEGIVSGTRYVGGVLGLQNAGGAARCFAAGAVAGAEHTGGFVGCNVGLITDCYATGSVVGTDRTGGLAGSNWGQVRNCHATAIVSGTKYVGGLLGYTSGPVTACYATGSVRGADYSGGLAGSNYDDVIAACYASGDVTGVKYIGGLVGDNDGSLTNCYAVGNASGTEYVGGLTGRNSRGPISYCYSTGRVTGARHVGALVAESVHGGVVASFWNVETSGLTVSDGGQGKKTAELRMMTSFLLWGACDNAGKWVIEETEDYPRLAWEGRPGQPIATTTLSSFLPGRGTEDDPILIATAEDLYAISLFPCDWNKHFRLVADIDLSAFGNTPFTIGTEETPFRGVFDGAGHTIAHFSSTTDFRELFKGSYEPGLFGYVSDPNAGIRDVGLVDPEIDTWGGHIGALVGYLRAGTLANCYVVGGTVGGGPGNVGGLVGFSEGRVTNCHATTSVTGSCAGGLVGHNRDTISNSHASGEVSGIHYAGGLVGLNEGLVANCCATGAAQYADYAGGLAGANWGSSPEALYAHYPAGIINCYATGPVDGSVAGGLVGRNGGDVFGNDYDGTISCCYATGRVTNSPNRGGLIGLQIAGVIESSFWDMQTSGLTTSASGTGKTTAEMNVASTFTEAGWDFVDEIVNGTEDIWWIDEGKDYPRLTWELESGGSGSEAGTAAGGAVGDVREATSRER